MKDKAIKHHVAMVEPTNGPYPMPRTFRGATTLSIMAFSIMRLSIMGLIVTLNIQHVQYYLSFG